MLSINAVAVALNHEKIGKHREIITKIKARINKYKWQRINYPPNIKKKKKNDCKIFEKNSLAIANCS